MLILICLDLPRAKHGMYDAPTMRRYEPPLLPPPLIYCSLAQTLTHSRNEEHVHKQSVLYIITMHTR